MTTQTAMPRRIAADTHTGKWSLPKPKGHRISTFQAREIADFATEGVIWASFGHVNGQEMFSRERYLADTHGNLHVYGQHGGKVIVHPADRALRVLAK